MRALRQAAALVAAEQVADEDGPGAVGTLQRLCRVALRELPASGAVVGIVPDVGGQIQLVASDDASEAVTELQVTLGEGPCLEAHQSGRPILVPDLAMSTRFQWLVYTAQATARGVAAEFAFPLRIGDVRLGALDLHRAETGPLSVGSVAFALALAELARNALLDAQQSTREGDSQLLDDAPVNVFELYQAQGMVMVQLGVTISEAMVRIRAHAFTHDRPISEVASHILAHSLTMHPDGDWPS